MAGHDDEDGKDERATLRKVAGGLSRALTMPTDNALPAPGDTLASASLGPVPVREASAALDESGPRYERLDLLGQGGMGTVWLSRDARIGRRVAMKTVRHGEADAGTRARFLREARVQGQLEHPAVVPVYDLGTTPEGDVFFTMKRVRGDTLALIIQRLRNSDVMGAAASPYSERRLLTAFSQICLAVDYAHARGVLHRDLKPENLMLGDHGEIYVLDWGVARVVHDDLDEAERSLDPEELRASASTDQQTGVAGTPGYIAPEKPKGQP